VQRILTFITRLTRFCLRSLNYRFVAWTTPDTTSLLLLTLTNQARSKSELVAENALLRQQLIILRRQVKRPACTKTDRILLVLLARMVRTWKQAHITRSARDASAVASSGISVVLEVQVEGYFYQTKDIPGDRCLDWRRWQGTIAVFGAKRIRGELLKLSIHVSKRTIQKYMRQFRTTWPRGQTWSTFLHTHAQQIWACDAPFCHRSPLPLALRLLHHPSALAQSDPRGCDTISH
jgi:putative transposase